MRIGEFVEEYGISIEHIHNNVRNKIYPKAIFYKPFNSKVNHIDENWFIRRWKFQNKVQMANQDLYYFFTEHMPPFHFCQLLSEKYGKHVGSYRQYMDKGLFAIDETLSTTRINSIAWNMYRFWWQLDRRLKRRGTSIEKILDKRMET